MYGLKARTHLTPSILSTAVDTRVEADSKHLYTIFSTHLTFTFCHLFSFQAFTLPAACHHQSHVHKTTIDRCNCDCSVGGGGVWVCCTPTMTTRPMKLVSFVRY